MISKLPRWVWAGAWALAFIAGIVNVVGLLGFEHQAVTHLTGTTSMLAATIASLDIPAIVHFASIIASFLAGTILSGNLLQDRAAIGAPLRSRPPPGVRPSRLGRSLAQRQQHLRHLLRLQCVRHLGYAALLIPSGLTTGTALVYSLYSLHTPARKV